jgi:hypothetical protein
MKEVVVTFNLSELRLLDRLYSEGMDYIPQDEIPKDSHVGVKLADALRVAESET